MLNTQKTPHSEVAESGKKTAPNRQSNARGLQLITESSDRWQLVGGLAGVVNRKRMSVACTSDKCHEIFNWPTSAEPALAREATALNIFRQPLQSGRVLQICRNKYIYVCMYVLK